MLYQQFGTPMGDIRSASEVVFFDRLLSSPAHLRVGIGQISRTNVRLSWGCLSATYLCRRGVLLLCGLLSAGWGANPFVCPGDWAFLIRCSLSVMSMFSLQTPIDHPYF